ncbi:MAG: phosphodiester glycosidase family protein [Moorea sp. SIO2B7]|nr:phosphodiester glycosidase family protein [Moorena sp. SIO2B7]
MEYFPQQKKKPILSFIILLVTIVPLLFYGMGILQRPPQTSMQEELFVGVTYQRQVKKQPRPVMIHVVSVDLTAPGIKLIVSPGVQDYQHTLARTTTEFLEEFSLQIAVNGSFFYPFEEATPWDYYPHSGDPVNAVGQAIANNIPYAPPQPNWYPLCILSSEKILISEQIACPSGTEFALSGSHVLKLEEKIEIKGLREVGGIEKAYPRVLIGTNSKGNHLWIAAIDGKQPFYSEGMTLQEVAQLMQELGATVALNLDGGGSTTLAKSTPNGSKLLNAPIQTKLPMRERPVANHLGIYALSLPSKS